MKNTVGVLFCGGKGIRMRPLTYYIQKVMLPISGKPILEYILLYFKKHGVTDLILLVDHMKEQIQGYFDNGERWGLNLSYVPDKSEPKGTGTALLNAKKYIKGRRVIVYYSDIITDANLTEMIQYHQNHGKWATILATRGWQIRVGTAEIDEAQYVRSFKEKPTLELLVNTGISILEPIIFNYLNEFDPNISIDLSRDIFPNLVEKKQMKAYIPKKCYWEDIGSIERYEKLDIEKIKSIME